MKCYVCSKEDFHWRKDLNPRKHVGICKECGNVAFKIEEGEEEKINNFYRSNYRGSPAVGNIITSTRKLNYIKLFLTDYLKDKKNLIVADIGAGIGYVCNWARQLGHRATGSELTVSFRRFSEHFYGVPLTEKIEPKHKYNLIVFYHTLEHMISPDEKLKYHASLLADDGVIMVSVPQWMNKLENLAAIGELTIDNYFHKNHVNCFTDISMKNLFIKCGLEIIKEDYQTYGQTYLVKKGKVVPAIQKEDWQEINAKIDKIKLAIESFQKGKFKEAAEHWAYFPNTYLRYIFDIIRKEPDRQDHEFAEILKKYPDDNQIILAYGVWNYQNQKYEEAMKYFMKSIAIVPNEDSLIYMGWTLDRLGRHTEAMSAFNKAAIINPQKWTECTNFMSKCACSIPTWDEKAAHEIKERMFKEAAPKIELKDKVMEDTTETKK